jgi:hypothetical protein
VSSVCHARPLQIQLVPSRRHENWSGTDPTKSLAMIEIRCEEVFASVARHWWKWVGRLGSCTTQVGSSVGRKRTQREGQNGLKKGRAKSLCIVEGLQARQKAMR